MPSQCLDPASRACPPRARPNLVSSVASRVPIGVALIALTGCQSGAPSARPSRRPAPWLGTSPWCSSPARAVRGHLRNLGRPSTGPPSRSSRATPPLSTSTMWWRSGTPGSGWPRPSGPAWNMCWPHAWASPHRGHLGGRSDRARAAPSSPGLPSTAPTGHATGGPAGGVRSSTRTGMPHVPRAPPIAQGSQGIPRR